MPSETQLPLFPDFEQLRSGFNNENVDYLLIGGYAVMVHAQPRATKDLDIFIRCDAENARAVWRALVQFGAPIGDVTEDYFAQLGNGFRMERPPIMIEILTRIDGVEFVAARARAVTEDINEAGLRVPIISAADLIANKLAAGRLQDLADVEAVRQGVEALRAQSTAANAPAQEKDE
jgi:hypothetical protein